MPHRLLLSGLLLALLLGAARAEEDVEADVEVARLEARLTAHRATGASREAALLLGSLAARLEQLGRREEALVRRTEAVEAWRALGRPSETARALYRRAVLEQRMQRLAEAEASLVAGIEGTVAANEPDARAFMLRRLSQVRSQRSDAAGALEAARAALRLEATLDDPGRAARTRSLVGTCLFRLGRYAEALDAHERALETFRTHDDVKGIPAALTRLGNVHQRTGSLAEARACYEEALGRYRELHDTSNVAVLLANLGIVHEVAGELERAEACYAEALEIHEAASDRRRLAATLAAAGIVDMRLARHEAALAKEGRAFELYEALQDRRGMASTLVNRTNILERQGRLSEARATCAQAAAVLGSDAPPAARAAVMWSRSRVLLAAGQPEEAVREARRAMDLVARLARGLTDTEEAGTRDVYDGLFDVCLRAAVELEDPALLAWVLEQGRAVVLRDGLAARCALSATNVSATLCRDVADVQAERGEAAEAFERANADGSRDGIRAARDRLVAAEAAVESAMRRVERRSKAAAHLLASEPLGLAGMRATVQPDEALVLYGIAEEVAVALVVRREEARRVALGPTARITAAVEALGVEVRPPAASDPGSRREDRIAAMARATGVRTRRVLLEGDWRRNDCGPLLAFRGEKRAPVALLLDGHQRYELFDPVEGTRTPLTPALEAGLHPDAVAWTRPLPAHPLTLRDLFLFPLHGRVPDLVLMVATAALATLLGMLTPQATAVIMDSAIPDANRHLLFELGLALLAAAFGQVVFRVSQSYVSARMSARAEESGQAAVWDRLLGFRPSFFRDFSSGDLMDRAMSSRRSASG